MRKENIVFTDVYRNHRITLELIYGGYGFTVSNIDEGIDTVVTVFSFGSAIEAVCAGKVYVDKLLKDRATDT